jgi:hypothetical protein
MKKLNNNKSMFLFIASLLFSWMLAVAQETPHELVLDLKYVVKNNQAPYILVYSKVKLDKRKFETVAGVPVKIYLDKQDESSLLGKTVTDDKGKGAVYLPASLKSIWDSQDSHTFLAYSDPKKPYDETSSELKITKARISIDTLNEDETRSVVVKVEEMSNGKWVPANEVELKACVKRMDGDLSVNDKVSFTTDTSGQITAEFHRDSIPGDANGNIVLVGKVEDNDNFGNLYIEKSVKWGAPFKYVSNFNERTLFATRDKAPGWLIFIAVLIVTIVWGTMIYLIFQIFKIRKLGKQTS